MEDMRSPEEITLASEPEEEHEVITLDEGDEEEEDSQSPKKMSAKDKEKAEEKDLAKLVEMDSLLGMSEFVAQMTENNNMLARFTSNCWFSAPSQWKPSMHGVSCNSLSFFELWSICRFGMGLSIKLKNFMDWNKSALTWRE